MTYEVTDGRIYETTDHSNAYNKIILTLEQYTPYIGDAKDNFSKLKHVFSLF